MFKKNTISYKILAVFLSAIISASIGFIIVRAGASIDSPGDPSSAGRMYTLENIYDYLTTGTAPSKATGAFANPTAGPGSTMHTTDEIFAAITDVYADAVSMPATGQTTSYRTADDGDHETGSVLSYTDNGDGTVTDDNTGLMWAKDGNGAGCNNGSTAIWNSAIDYCDGLTFATYSDWRLPNIKELYGITKLDANQSDPYIDQTYFPNTQSFNYWSSTTFPAYIGVALYVHFSLGAVYPNDKADYDYVRCVRGQQGFGFLGIW